MGCAGSCSLDHELHTFSKPAAWRTAASLGAPHLDTCCTGASGSWHSQYPSAEARTTKAGWDQQPRSGCDCAQAWRRRFTCSSCTITRTDWRPRLVQVGPAFAVSLMAYCARTKARTKCSFRRTGKRNTTSSTRLMARAAGIQMNVLERSRGDIRVSLHGEPPRSSDAA